MNPFHPQPLRKIAKLRPSILTLAAALALVLWAAPAPAEPWFVLPDSIEPYTSPSLSAPRTGKTLRYRDTVEGQRAESTDKIAWIQITHDNTPAWLPEPYLVRKIDNPAANLPIGAETVDKNTPLPLDYKPSDLAELDPKWAYQTGARIRLRPPAARAAERLLRAAKTEKINLRIASAYRPPMQQRFVYLRKIQETGFDQKLVAKPGHSEHQLGTAIDLCGLDPKTSLQQSFGESPEGLWIAANAHKFGFRLSYPKNSEADTGFMYEPWHLRYVGGETPPPPRR